MIRMSIQFRNFDSTVDWKILTAEEQEKYRLTRFK